MSEDRGHLLKLFERVQNAELTPLAAFDEASAARYEDIGFAKLDRDRTARCGMPEVIFGQGKTSEQVAEIFVHIRDTGADVLATRLSEQAREAILALVPGASVNAIARTATLRQSSKPSIGNVGIVCAGTSDLPVAEEAAVTADLFGATVTLVSDVGVAGLHRLLSQMELLRKQDVLVVCAGMEGALPSVVAGLVECPVLAVPTSVGYGASLGGVTALLGMLNSCAPNVSVVNIDNGFGAGYQATIIARKKSGSS